MPIAQRWGFEIASQTSTHIFNLNISYYQMGYQFIVDLDIANSDSDGLIKLGCYLVIDLIDGSRNDSSILKVVAAPCHSERFAGTRLTVTQYGPVKSLYNRCHNLIRTSFIDFLLAIAADSLHPHNITLHCLVSYRIWTSMNPAGYWRRPRLSCQCLRL